MQSLGCLCVLVATLAAAPSVARAERATDETPLIAGRRLNTVANRSARARLLGLENRRTCRATPPSSGRLQRLIRSWLGTPYVYGQEEKGSGTDCSGFIRKLYAEGFGISLPRTSRAQSEIGAPVQASSLQPGDLVFFDFHDQGKIDHVGVYVGADRFVHASASNGVRYSSLKSKSYVRAYQGARRPISHAACS